MAAPAPSFTTTSSSSLDAIGQLTPTNITSTSNTTSSSSNNNTKSTNTFQFPREYHFPPFFTRQPNLSTRHSQHLKWAHLILSYCAHHKLYKLSLTSPSTADLFHNRHIDRRLSLADAREVLEFLRRDGRVEYIKSGNSSATAAALNSLTGVGDDGGDDSGGGGGDVVWVYWRTPEEWASLIESWVEETAQKGTVLTLYELSQGEDTTGTGKFASNPSSPPL
ncbi:ESCRT-II complex subunit-domain-containing protein [Xylaria arbuscula]|nr:ESCRT-II complex subunit-domain-containing protein [Xylaria arbuscula]